LEKVLVFYLFGYVTPLGVNATRQVIMRLMIKWLQILQGHLMDAAYTAAARTILSAVGSYMGVLCFQYLFQTVLLALLQKIQKMLWIFHHMYLIVALGWPYHQETWFLLLYGALILI
jgi:hypothetical protein